MLTKFLLILATDVAVNPFKTEAAKYEKKQDVKTTAIAQSLLDQVNPADELTKKLAALVQLRKQRKAEIIKEKLQSTISEHKFLSVGHRLMESFDTVFVNSYNTSSSFTIEINDKYGTYHSLVQIVIECKLTRTR